MISILSLLALAGCGRNITESDVKFAGVGLNPDEIGPEPAYYGGYVEVDRIEYGGGALSLGSVGFQSFDEVGLDMMNFQPPYAMIYGLSFMFDEMVPSPDVLHGSIGVGPELDGQDACWTNVEPFSYLMASTVELGSELRFTEPDGETAFTVGRYPEIYPPNPQDVFVYYSTVQVARETAVPHLIPDGNGGWVEETLLAPNWEEGGQLQMSFGGGLPPLEAPVSSIPVPSTAVDAQLFNLPNNSHDLRLNWAGNAYAPDGSLLEGSDWTTCVQFYAEAGAPADFDTDCTELIQYQAGGSGPGGSSSAGGQIYTGPWDTDDGSVSFTWEAQESEGERVTLNIRFLAPVDRNAETFLTPVVPTSDGRQRQPLVCDGTDDGLEYVFDESLLDEEGELLSTLQGDPTSNLVEVSCSLVDDGEFTLTNDHLATALAYAEEKGAEGAVFYFSRGTTLEAEVPDVRDQAGMRRNISPVMVRANSVVLGRFWVNDPTDLHQGGN